MNIGRDSRARTDHRLRHLRSVLSWGAGAVVLAWVLAQPDYPELLALLRRAGPALLWVLWLEPLRWASQAAAWQLLFFPGQRLPFRTVLWASAVASAVNDLLPALSVGGNLLKARHVIHRGIPRSQATAVGIVDISLHGVSALGWSLIGLTALGLLSDDAELFRTSLTGSLFLVLAIGLFVGAQWFASARMARLLQQRFGARGWDRLAEGTDRTRHYLVTLWRRRTTCLVSVLSRMAGRALMVPEILFVGWLMGTGIAIWQAMAITGLVILVKTVSFMIPARIGVQEGAFLATGALLGLETELMFAIALTVRLREVLPQIPVLAVWWFSESRRLNGSTGHDPGNPPPPRAAPHEPE